MSTTLLHAERGDLQKLEGSVGRVSDLNVVRC